MKPKADSFKEFVVEQLWDLPEVNVRRMFGAFGLYSEGKFFGIISEGRIYFKTNPTTRQDYIERGSKPFQPTPKQTLKNYYEVPADVLEDPVMLQEWAALSCRD